MKNFITEFKKILTEIRVNIFNLLRWCIFATLVGLFVGGISVAFSALDIRANNLLKTYPEMLYGLPFAGLIIVFLYRFAGIYKAKGTNLVISTIQAKTELPVVMAPLIFVSTLITHAFGGSVGREGAALQLGSAAAAGLNKIKWLKLSEEEKRMIIMCGMSAAFSAIFGTPIAAVFFPMEVASIGIIQYSAMFPCFVSSVTASWLAHMYGFSKAKLGSVIDVGLDIEITWKVAVLAIFCGLLSIAFCLMLKGIWQWLCKASQKPLCAGLFGRYYLCCYQSFDWNKGLSWCRYACHRAGCRGRGALVFIFYENVSYCTLYRLRLQGWRGTAVSLYRCNLWQFLCTCFWLAYFSCCGLRDGRAFRRSNQLPYRLTAYHF